jgi:hypothetical protein
MAMYCASVFVVEIDERRCPLFVVRDAVLVGQGKAGADQGRRTRRLALSREHESEPCYRPAELPDAERRVRDLHELVLA